MSASDPLLQPFRLKNLELKNRIVSTSHSPAYAEDGMPKERYQAYHEEKAKGGLGLTMFGGSSNIAPDSPSVFGQLYVGTDEVIPYFQAFAERMHGHGAALMCQLTHMGRRTTWAGGNWLSTIAPSRVREPAHRAFPKEMDQYDIDRVVRAFGEAARRCKAGGLDGIEILAHGHLVDQFWTPSVNKRTDGYGGSLKNRMRFSFEVLDEVRRQTGPEFIVGIRMGMSEDFEGGLTVEDGLEIAAALEATGQVDFLNLNKGHIDTDNALAHMMPGMSHGLAPHLDAVAHFKRQVGLPVIHACRVNDLATARHALSEGIVDLVGMTRAHMADPHIVRKLAAGAEETIRPCVGAGYCIDRIYEGGAALCLHNTATGRETTMPQRIAPTDGAAQKIVVIGGGPGGLEAARVTAERGHQVVLFEAAAELGGQIVLAAKAGWRRDLGDIARWYSDELDRLGVQVRLNAYAETGDVIAESPDVVIVATGGIPDTECVDGGEHCVSVWDILGGSTAPGDNVLIFDDHGQHQGPSCAEVLSEHAEKVELVTTDRMAAAEMGAINYPIYMKHLYASGVTLTPDRRLMKVEREGNQLRATLRNEFTGDEEIRLVDQVVVEHGTLPIDELFHDLRDGSRNSGEVDQVALAAGKAHDVTINPDGAYRLYRIGDAVSSRNIHAAIFDALRLCKDL